MIRLILLIAMSLSASGCYLFDPPVRTPIGHSTDENGRRCSTYQTKSGSVYETICDYQ